MAVANDTYFYLNFMGQMHDSALIQLTSEQFYQKTQMHQWVRFGTIHILFPIAFPDLPSLGPCQPFQVSNYSCNEWVGCYAAWFLITISHSIFQAKGLNQLENNTGQTGLESNNSRRTILWSYPTAKSALSGPILLCLPWKTAQEGVACYLLSPLD